MATKAKELEATGKTIYDLSLGELDFDTPKHICDASVEAMTAGHTRQTRIIHGPGGLAAERSTPTRSASEDNSLCSPRLRFGLVWSHE